MGSNGTLEWTCIDASPSQTQFFFDNFCSKHHSQFVYMIIPDPSIPFEQLIYPKCVSPCFTVGEKKSGKHLGCINPMKQLNSYEKKKNCK